MKKVLMLSTYGDFLATFELSNISLWRELECEVHAVSNFSADEYNLKTRRLDDLGVICHEIKFERSPFKKSNFTAFRQLLCLIRREQFDIIDCHNAVIGAFARLAAAICQVPKVIYTPHSFFFYKGCPKKNLLLFKTAESLLARKTDLLIAINQEDYHAAQAMKIRGKALYVPGIGIDTVAIAALPAQRMKYREELNLPQDAKIFISVGELIARKNHATAIKAFAEALPDNAYYVICGIGEKETELNELITSLGMQGRIRLLGYRQDVKELMKAADVFVFPSLQEGLPVALMEAMAAGLPCVVSRIRGNTDLIDSGKGGILFDSADEIALAKAISELADNKKKRESYGQHNIRRVKEFDITNVQHIMRKEYARIIKELS